MCARKKIASSVKIQKLSPTRLKTASRSWLPRGTTIGLDEPRLTAAIHKIPPNLAITLTTHVPFETATFVDSNLLGLSLRDQAVLPQVSFQSRLAQPHDSHSISIYFLASTPKDLVDAIEAMPYHLLCISGYPFEVSDADTMLEYINPAQVKPESVSIITKPNCPFCTKAKALLEAKGYVYEEIVLGQHASLTSLKAISGRETVPQVFIGGEHIGGSDDLEKHFA